MKKFAIILLVSLLVAGFSTLTLASEDGFGMSTSVSYAYVVLETGPFIGEIPIKDYYHENPADHVNMGLSLESPWEAFYFGGLSKWAVDFSNDELGFKSVSLFAGYQHDWSAMKWKLEFGPKFDESFVPFDTQTWAGFFRLRVLFNPFDLFDVEEAA